MKAYLVLREDGILLERWNRTQFNCPALGMPIRKSYKKQSFVLSFFLHIILILVALRTIYVGNRYYLEHQWCGNL